MVNTQPERNANIDTNDSIYESPVIFPIKKLLAARLAADLSVEDRHVANELFWWRSHVKYI